VLLTGSRLSEGRGGIEFPDGWRQRRLPLSLRERWLVIGDGCPVLRLGSFFIFCDADAGIRFAKAAEAEQVVERAGVCSLEAGFHAVQHL